MGKSWLAALIANSSMIFQATSTSLHAGFSAMVCRIRFLQAGSSFFKTARTIVGFEVAPTAPLAMAYASSSTEHESFQYWVAVAVAVSCNGLRFFVIMLNHSFVNDPVRGLILMTDRTRVMRDCLHQSLSFSLSGPHGIFPSSRIGEP